MGKQIACFLVSGFAWLVIWNGPFLSPLQAQLHPPGDTEPSCDRATDAEEERHRRQLLELQKTDIEATKDYNNRLLVCQADKQCREAAREELTAKRRHIRA